MKFHYLRSFFSPIWANDAIKMTTNTNFHRILHNITQYILYYYEIVQFLLYFLNMLGRLGAAILNQYTLQTEFCSYCQSTAHGDGSAFHLLSQLEVSFLLRR